MTKNSEIYGKWDIKLPKIKKYRMKTCSISGRKYRATKDNFYTNNNSADGLHPYHKKFDNFRRTTNTTVEQMRNLVTLIKG